jgi:hypothetical protein
VTCLSCQSVEQLELIAEMLIHFPGLKNVDKPAVWLFPRLLVCPNCGFSRFTVPETELASIAKNALEKSADDLALH